MAAGPFGFGPISPGYQPRLPQSVIDPATGLPYSAAMDPNEIVQRGTVLPVGRTRAGDVVPAGSQLGKLAWELGASVPDAVPEALRTINYFGDVAQGNKALMDPTTGSVSDEAVGHGLNAAGGAMTGGFAGGVGRQAGEAVLGSGPIFSREALYNTPNVPQFDLPRNVPARGVSQRVQDLVANPQVRDKMMEKIQHGIDLGGPGWYNLGPMRDEFVKELGPDRGTQAFNKYLDIAAATSPQSTVDQNVRNASYYYSQWMKGEPYPPIGVQNPHPYGHFAANTHKGILNQIMDTGWDPLQKPKTASFTQNLQGNWDPGTIDKHATRLPAMLSEDPRFLATTWRPDDAKKGTPGRNIQQEVLTGKMSMEDALKEPTMWTERPNANEYAALEQYYKSLGREYGMQAAPTQASAWVGGGQLTGLGSNESLPFMGFVEDRINLSAQKRDLDPREVLRRFIRGEQPLLSVAAPLPLAQEQEPRR